MMIANPTGVAAAWVMQPARRGGAGAGLGVSDVGSGAATSTVPELRPDPTHMTAPFLHFLSVFPTRFPDPSHYGICPDETIAF
jgi:hypothetical protein